jgi:hypothetical protein
LMISGGAYADRACTKSQCYPSWYRSILELR